MDAPNTQAQRLSFCDSNGSKKDKKKKAKHKAASDVAHSKGTGPSSRVSLASEMDTNCEMSISPTNASTTNAVAAAPRLAQLTVPIPTSQLSSPNFSSFESVTTTTPAPAVTGPPTQPGESSKKKKKKKKKKATRAQTKKKSGPGKGDESEEHGDKVAIPTPALPSVRVLSRIEELQKEQRERARMADRLTQIQDCLDQFATQMFASIHYVSSHHSSSAIQGQPNRSRNAATTNSSTNGTVAATAAVSTPGTPAGGDAKGSSSGGGGVAGGGDDAGGVGGEGGGDGEGQADPPAVFAATLRELSRDLVIKEQQIEFLVKSLPGITTSKDEQEARLFKLQKELEEVEQRAVQAKKERDELVERVEEAMLALHRVY